MAGPSVHGQKNKVRRVIQQQSSLLLLSVLTLRSRLPDAAPQGRQESWVECQTKAQVHQRLNLLFGNYMPITCYHFLCASPRLLVALCWHSKLASCCAEAGHGHRASVKSLQGVAVSSKHQRQQITKHHRYMLKPLNRWTQHPT